ncbi:MAG: DUF3006 domain-containing protein [Clostridia bacterium]|nr:DUF3006 domain-containing protein [Clostridia bacterium]
MKIYSVDRIENNVAVCECESEIIKIPTSQLPSGTREGDLLGKTDSGFIALPDETAQKKKSLFELQKSLFKK